MSVYEWTLSKTPDKMHLNLNYCAFDIFQKVDFCLALYTEEVYLFSLFPIVKMNANYAEICRVGNFEADFR